MTKEIIVKMSDELKAKVVSEYVAMICELVEIKKDELPNITNADSAEAVLRSIEKLQLTPEEKEKLEILKYCSRVFIKGKDKEGNIINYGNESILKAFITNLDKYHDDGAVVGEWVKFPANYEEMQKVFEHIGINEESDRWFITDYDCSVDGLHKLLGEFDSIDELNYLTNRIAHMPSNERTLMEAAIAEGEYTGSIKDLINLTANLEGYDLLTGVHDHKSLGFHLIKDSGNYDLDSMGELADYINYEAFGRDYDINNDGVFTNKGYTYRNGREFYEMYNGKTEDIPKECCVTPVIKEEKKTFDIERLRAKLNRESKEIKLDR